MDGWIDGWMVVCMYVCTYVCIVIADCYGARWAGPGPPGGLPRSVPSAAPARRIVPGGPVNTRPDRRTVTGPPGPRRWESPAARAGMLIRGRVRRPKERACAGRGCGQDRYACIQSRWICRAAGAAGA
jgi:hypothetical protein